VKTEIVGSRAEELRDDHVGVSNAAFCAELKRRRLSETQLTFMYGLVVNECNRCIVESLKDDIKEGNQHVRTQLALIEKVWFIIDTMGKGYITVDDVLLLVVAIHRYSGTEEKSLMLADIALDCVKLLESFGGWGFYRGRVTLARFKDMCLGPPKRKNGAKRINCMELQKFLVTLTNLRNEIGPKRVAGQCIWNEAIEVELDDTDAEHLALSRFISVRGSRIRLECFKHGKPWGTDEEIQLLWATYRQGKAETQKSRNLYKNLERVVFRYVSMLDSLIMDALPKRYVPSIETYFEQENTSSGSNAFSVTTHTHMFIAENKSNEKEAPVKNAATNAFVLTPEPQEDLHKHIPVQESLDDQRDGAFYIEAFRLFQVEQTQLYDVDPGGVNKKWEDLSRKERQVYVKTAKAAKKQQRDPPSKDGLLDPPRCVIAKGTWDQLEQGTTHQLSNVIPGCSEWEPLSVDAMVEQIVSSRFLYAQNPNNLAVDLSTQSGQLSPCEGNVLARDGVLYIRARKRNMWEKCTFSLLHEQQVLLRHANEGGAEEEICLHGAMLLPALVSVKPSQELSDVPPFRFSITSGAETWQLSALTKQDMDGWIADICFVIAEDTECSTYQPLSNPVVDACSTSVPSENSAAFVEQSSDERIRMLEIAAAHLRSEIEMEKLTLEHGQGMFGDTFEDVDEDLISDKDEFEDCEELI